MKQKPGQLKRKQGAASAGEIHSDFEKKFIRAEVINSQKLLEIGGWNQAKQKGSFVLRERNI